MHPIRNSFNFGFSFRSTFGMVWLCIQSNSTSRVLLCSQWNGIGCLLFPTTNKRRAHNMSCDARNKKKRPSALVSHIEISNRRSFWETRNASCRAMSPRCAWHARIASCRKGLDFLKSKSVLFVVVWWNRSTTNSILKFSEQHQLRKPPKFQIPSFLWANWQF